MASSSRPNASACSRVRAIVLLDISFSPRSSLESNFDIADRDGHADLHVFVRAGRDRAGGQVSYGAGGLAPGAGVTDAHPASVLGCQAGGLGLFQQRAAVVSDVNVAFCKADSSAGWVCRGLEDRRD